MSIMEAMVLGLTVMIMWDIIPEVFESEDHEREL